jgi:hypothetical protein
MEPPIASQREAEIEAIEELNPLRGRAARAGFADPTGCYK